VVGTVAAPATDVEPEAPGRDAYGSLFAVHQGAAFRLALVVAGGDRALAEDAVSEAFIRTLPRWQAGQVDDFGPYLRRAVVRQLLGTFRRRGYERGLTTVPAAGDDGRFEDGVVTSQVLWAALRQLPPRQRAALALFYLQDQPLDEVARAMGTSVGTAKAHLSRGRDKLRELLA
jgi:RNA polymerase sigma factor (sigma-70 family)